MAAPLFLLLKPRYITRAGDGGTAGALGVVITLTRQKAECVITGIQHWRYYVISDKNESLADGRNHFELLETENTCNEFMETKFAKSKIEMSPITTARSPVTLRLRMIRSEQNPTMAARTTMTSPRWISKSHVRASSPRWRSRS